MSYKLICNLFLLITLSNVFSTKVNAQIVPDNTLGVESSTIRTVDDLKEAIEGGAIRGDNLFHSFEQFAVQEGLKVNFANPKNVSNIFSRVTGGNISEIFGTLGVDGGANLFLINPNGIVFGENAVIDVGGSFMATTAESIEFNSGDHFSSTNSNMPQLITDFPLGLGLGSNPGDIIVEGEQNSVQLEIPSFRVFADDLPQSIGVEQRENISLIGGKITFEGGGIQAPGGDIEIVSLAGNQEIKLLQDGDWFEADLTNDTLNFKDVFLRNAAYLDVSDEEAGNINLSGRQVIVDDGSAILANTFLATSNEVNINASESLEIRGTSGEFNVELSFIDTINNNLSKEVQNNYSVSLIMADVFSGSEGSGNNININADAIKILDAGQVRTVNFSQNESFAGNINIKADNIVVEGASSPDSLTTSVINSSTASGSTGNSGNVNIATQRLELRDGGRIKADSFGNGSGGNIEIDADDILLEGFVEPFVPIFTGIFASTSKNDKLGNIIIKTETLNIFDGALISSSTFGRGSAGNINVQSKLINVSGSIPFDPYFPSSIISSVILDGNINNEVARANPSAGNISISTEQFKVLNGARIEATNSIGDSGNISIDAKDIELNGTRPRVLNFIGGISTSTPRLSSGNGGDIDINTGSLKIFDGSIIRAVSLGSGDAGNININADFVEIAGADKFANNPFELGRVSKINTGAVSANGGNLNINADLIALDKKTQINASSIQGDRGGNITLNTDSLELQGQSQITASAGGQGNGGNITIDANTILGIENSDITANAVGGSGGNIAIDSNSVLGLEARSQATPFSDITASSELGIDGTVIINSPDGFINEESLTAFQEISFDSAKILIDGSCINPYRRSAAGTIIDRGRGGIPESPDNYFDEPELMRSQPKPTDAASKEIIEANRAVQLPSGSVELLARTQVQSFEDRLCLVRSREK